jgi:hypothetical protein
MSFKVKGKVFDILPVQTGTSARGEWKKQDFVIETSDDQYPKKICFTLFNDKVDMIKGVGNNSEVEVSFSIESREYNGKWFSNVNAYKIDKPEQTAPAPGFDAPPFTSDDIPPMGEGSSTDDLPF